MTVRVKHDIWQVRVWLNGRWHMLTEPVTRFADAVRVYSSTAHAQMLRNGRPLAELPEERDTLFD